MADDIVVTIGAKIDELVNGVNDVKSKLDEVGRHGKEAGDSAAASFGELKRTLLELAGVGGLMELAKQALELGTQTHNMSVMLGVSTEAIAGLRYAAEASGTSLEAMAQVGERLLVTIQRSTRDAFSPATIALKNLGLSAADFKGLNFQDSLLKLADSAGQYSNENNVLAQTLQILVGRNQALLPLLMQGGDAMRDLINVGKEHSALSEQQVHDLHAAEQAWVLFKQAVLAAIAGANAAELKKFFDVLLTGIDAIKESVKWLSDLAAGFERFNDGVKEAGRWVRENIPGFQQIATAIEYYRDVQERTASVSGAFGAAAYAGVVKPVNDSMSAVNTARSYMGAYADSIRQTTAATNEHAEAQKKILPALQLNAKQALEIQAQELNERVAKARGAQEILIAEYNRDASQYKITQVQKVVSTGDAKLAIIGIELDAARQKAELWRADPVKYAEAQAAIAKLSAEYGKQVVDNQTATSKAVEGVWLGALSTLQNAWDSQLKGLLFGSTKWADAMKSIWQDLTVQIIKDLEKIAIEKLAVGLAGAALTGGVGGGAASASLGGVLLSGLGKLFGFQEGTPYVPETGLALMHKGEMVIPANVAEMVRSGRSSVGTGGGGNAVTLNLSVATLDTSTMASWLRGPGGQLIANSVSKMWSNNPTMRPAY